MFRDGLGKARRDWGRLGGIGESRGCLEIDWGRLGGTVEDMAGLEKTVGGT